MPGEQGPGKKWEHLDVNKKGNVLVSPIHVRKGDTVQVIAGKDKGKVGEVTKARAQRPSQAPCRPRPLAGRRPVAGRCVGARAGGRALTVPRNCRCCQSTARWWWRA